MIMLKFYKDLLLAKNLYLNLIDFNLEIKSKSTSKDKIIEDLIIKHFKNVQGILFTQCKSHVIKYQDKFEYEDILICMTLKKMKENANFIWYNDLIKFMRKCRDKRGEKTNLVTYKNITIPSELLF